MDSAPQCQLSFWSFAGPVLIGSLAGLGTSYIAQRLATGEHPETARTIGRIASLATFWTVGGIAFVALNKHNVPGTVPAKNNRW